MNFHMLLLEDSLEGVPEELLMEFTKKLLVLEKSQEKNSWRNSLENIPTKSQEGTPMRISRQHPFETLEKVYRGTYSIDGSNFFRHLQYEILKGFPEKYLLELQEKCLKGTLGSTHRWKF